MFTMEEVGSPLDGPRNGCSKNRVTFKDSNASDDDDEDDLRICPITDDPISPTKGFCDYPKNLVRNQQLSNSLPKNSFTYKVRISQLICSKYKLQEAILDFEYSYVCIYNTAQLYKPVTT